MRICCRAVSPLAFFALLDKVHKGPIGVNAAVGDQLQMLLCENGKSARYKELAHIDST